MKLWIKRFVPALAILALTAGFAEEGIAPEETPVPEIAAEATQAVETPEASEVPEAEDAPQAEALMELSAYVGTHFMSFVNKIGDMWQMAGELTRYENTSLGAMTVNGETVDLMVFRTGGAYSLFGVTTGAPLEDARAKLIGSGWQEVEEEGWVSGTGAQGVRFDRDDGWMMILFPDESGVVEQVMCGKPEAALLVRDAVEKEFTQPTPTPAPTADPTQAGTVRIVPSAGSVNVRANAGTGYDVLTGMDESTEAVYLGEGKADAEGKCWYYVQVGNAKGWVSAKYTVLTLADGTVVTGEQGVLP
ncbi:MAG: SH3 domain-containing protein [Clostridia bacterium]|nr:SH3 domain-containing protein [Clostridia bacterium]